MQNGKNDKNSKNNKNNGSNSNNNKNVQLVPINTEKHNTNKPGRSINKNARKRISYYIKKKNRNFNLLVGLLTAFVILFGALVIGYVYRENIYYFFNKKNTDTQNNLNNSADSADPTDSIDAVFSEAVGITSEENSTGNISDTSNISNISNIPETIDPSSEAEASSASEISASEISEADPIDKTAETTSTINTINTTDTTSDITEPVISIPLSAGANPIYGVVPESDFLQKMFDNSFIIPGTSDKVEIPPKNRSAELQSKIVPLNIDIPEPYAYFKNIILLGDSVTTGFELYKSVIKFNGEPVLQDLNVVAAKSYGVYNALRDISNKSVHPLYDGKQMLPEDIIAQKDAEFVFICLGLNDITWMESIDDFINFYKILVDKIKAKNPDKIIAVMSVTPVVEGKVSGILTNERITNANNALIQFAGDNNLPFIDYAAAIRNGENALYTELSSDGYCHIIPYAYDRLVAYMLYHPLKS